MPAAPQEPRSSCALRRIDRAVLKPRDVHLVLDNYATHKTPAGAWSMAGENIHAFQAAFHADPAHQWLNMVERFFAEITTRRIRRGSYSSARRPGSRYRDYLGQHNTKPVSRLLWTKTADDILTREHAPWKNSMKSEEQVEASDSENAGEAGNDSFRFKASSAMASAAKKKGGDKPSIDLNMRGSLQSEVAQFWVNQQLWPAIRNQRCKHSMNPIPLHPRLV